MATCVLTVIALITPLISQGQSQGSAGSAMLQGSVRDSRGHPLVAAKVCLQSQSGAQILAVNTDAEGTYRFPALPEGAYTLRAEMAGYTEATFGPVVLGPRASKTVGLTLEPPTENSAAKLPEFFDEPQFTVAGVTESMNPGGHGSDRILRTAESLARDTASLSRKTPNRSQPASSQTGEDSLRAAVQHEPGSFDANYRLGKTLVDGGKAGEALPYLEHASELKPADYESAYELAVAYVDAGKYELARAKLGTLPAQQGRAELHHLLGDIDEKQGNSLEAVREYQRAAELSLSEPNLFDWGSELLIHRAAEPAIEVFAKGNRLFPRSVRMLIALGVAWYARGSYDQAATFLCEASDLNPNDPTPYLFLGKMQGVETTQSEEMVEKLARFARLQPQNALANYYYAVSLWKQRQNPSGSQSAAQVESLLEKAVRIDPQLGPAYLQLGIVYADRQEFRKAIPAYQKAIEVAPQLEEAYYRLSQAYTRTGNRVEAQKQLQLYDQVSKKTADEVERERREMQQFVYTLRGGGSALPQ
ncbi:MAG: tetratricopeptide repeat protein [Acidobacteriia bacterium]|nr:tetratricopeptide repeat protein [Terriglobia bacterium]